MEKLWEQMTPAEKRQQRFELWKNPQGMQFLSPEAERNYKIRVQRFIDVLNVEEPDMVPSFLSVGSIPAYLYGYNYKRLSYDYEKMSEVYSRFNDEHADDLDTYSLGINSLMPAGLLDRIDYRLYCWPGHGLADDARGFQYIEKEYMLANEYDALIRDPTDFWLRTYMPRIAGTLEPLGTISHMMNIVEFGLTDFMPLAQPPVQTALQALLDAGKEYARYAEALFPLLSKGIASGFPMLLHGFAKAPFDTLSDTMRGTKGMMMDMYRQPDKILAAVEKITDLTIETITRAAKIRRGPTILFPLHKGADGWMNQKQFDTFYWPSLKKVLNAVIDEGIVPFLFAEGGYDSRLGSINEFPKGSVAWFFDKTDMVKAKAAVGDQCCICGNLPASLLVGGTPEQVKSVCRGLIETAGKGGGYILSSGAFPDEAKLENLKAMVETAKEYGVYRSDTKPLQINKPRRRPE
jgi:uroporphyrinogen-III decarboxylase